MSQKGSLVKGISAEMQDCILATLIFDHEMYDATKSVMNYDFFYGEDYKTLYKALKEFHKNTTANPTLKDMMIEVSLLVSNNNELVNAKTLLKELHTDYIEEYSIKDDSMKRMYFEEFIKRNGAEYCFSTIIEDAKSDDGIDWGKVIPKFKKYTDFTIVSSKPFRMSDSNKLSEIRKEAVGTTGLTRKIRFFLDEVNDLMNHKAITPGTLNMISAPPGVGKTMTLVNQGCSAAMDGFTSLHVFLGDLNTYDANLRYLANFSHQSLSNIINMTEEEQQELQQFLNTNGETQGALDRCILLALPAGVFTVQALCNEILKVQSEMEIHFDQIIIDYDANILTQGDSMYDDGGIVYNYLREFGVSNKTVMFIAAQPKITFFNQEVLTLDAASESTKKQHVIDTMISLGKPGNLNAPISMMYIPKNRHGRAHKKIPLYIDGSQQRISTISMDEYERLKREAVDNY